jgi:dolichol-phosphate mannosyltransferase
MINKSKICVVIPAYKVKDHILTVLEGIEEFVDKIYIIDDACPEKSGFFVKENFSDPRLSILYHEKNKGVGAATISGYKLAIEDDIDIVVKIDGDNQMNPKEMKKFILPIINGNTDYAKGNRFFYISSIRGMPIHRIFGNIFLSFMTKLSTGYWEIFDPTNGYTAIHVKVLKMIELDKISNRFFFESDMLFRLNIIKAKVIDIPINSKYANEKSNLNVKKIFFEFIYKNLKNTVKRFIYSYFVRDFNIGSIELIFGIILVCFSLYHGLINWIVSIETNTTASAGTVMLSALPAIFGFQLVLSFFNYDTRKIDKQPLHINL